MNSLSIKISTLVLILFTVFGYAQIDKTDTVGNFYLVKNKLIWQKHYQLDDVNTLDKQLKNNHFTSKLHILDFETDVITDLFQLIANNLPQYAQSDYKAFLIIDIYRDTYRVTIKNITFPQFIENSYYNGVRQNSRSGALENYILKNNGNINKTNANLHVLNSFDNSFEEIFDGMSIPIKK
ncbi:MAG: hypothetical protein KAT78_04325 [Flavobacteriaceae bacterium]|nr:hypothetical protein [Flavobacteriaceae bacterium]